MKKFYRDTLDYVGGTILLRGIGIISFLYVGKLLPPAEFGYFGMALAVIALGAAFAQFGAPGLILRDFQVEGVRALIRTTPLVVVLWLLEMTFLIMFGNALGRMNEVFRATADHPYLIGVLVLTTTENMVLTSYLTTSLRARTVVVATVARSVVYMGCLVVLVSFNRSYLSFLYATLAADVTYIAVALIHCRTRLSSAVKELRFMNPIRAVIDQAGGGLLFFSRDVAGLIQSQLGRLVLSAYVPVADLGIYTFFTNIVNSLSQFPSALNQAYTPRLVAAYQKNPLRTGNLLCNILPAWAIGLTVGYVAIVATGELGLYRLAFRHDYLPHTAFLDAMVFIAISGAMLQTFYFSYYVGRKNTSVRTHAIVHLTTFVALQLSLTPKFGLLGAVMAEILASTFQLITLVIINYRLLSIGATGKDLRLFLVFVSLATFFVVVSLFVKGSWSVLISALTGLCIAYGLRSLPRFQRLYASLKGVEEWGAMETVGLKSGEMASP